ncbi:hypothetical protein [Iamia sp.]|uniref:hypothetical protein n=1 Tax=Iamia sp. TaxID=2722710 RepID=UPI002C97E7A2|nr:hypothetical protein [Iamia sp.]HXH58226.1 hypothetical protein [Iamia sp.]
MGSFDQVAVAVEPGVDLAESQLAVPGEDLDAGLTQGDAAHGDGFGRCGRQGITSEDRRTTTPLPRDDGPQLVARLGQLVEQVEAPLCHPHHRAVELVQLGEEPVARHLQLETGRRVQAGPSAVGEQAGIAQGRRAAAHQGAVPVPRACGGLRFGAGPLGRWAGHRHLQVEGSVRRSGDRDPVPW